MSSDYIKEPQCKLFSIYLHAVISINNNKCLIPFILTKYGSKYVQELMLTSKGTVVMIIVFT